MTILMHSVLKMNVSIAVCLVPCPCGRLHTPNPHRTWQAIQEAIPCTWNFCARSLCGSMFCMLLCWLLRFWKDEGQHKSEQVKPKTTPPKLCLHECFLQRRMISWTRTQNLWRRTHKMHSGGPWVELGLSDLCSFLRQLPRADFITNRLFVWNTRCQPVCRFLRSSLTLHFLWETYLN